MVRDARKAPWYLDLTPSEMEAVIAAVPALLEVAKAATFRDEPGEGFRALTYLTRRLDELDAVWPDWRTWLVVEQEGR